MVESGLGLPLYIQTTNSRVIFLMTPDWQGRVFFSKLYEKSFTMKTRSIQ